MVFKKNSKVVASQNPVSANLAGEAVILDPDSGMYYGLNEVGARVWELIQDPKTVDEIRDALLTEYEVKPERCERDLFALLQNLADKGLVEIDDGPDA